MMGMGEPLQNYAALLPALRVMLDDHGYGLSRRRVTVSTSGVVPMMERLGRDCPVALAVSLHAPTDALRDNLVPLNRKYPLQELMQPASPIWSTRHGISSRSNTACSMVSTTSPSRRMNWSSWSGARSGASNWCKFNLIPFNPFPASGLAGSPAPAGISAFARILTDAGIVTTIRKTRGDDIDAACGQLAGDVRDRTGVAGRIAQQRTIMLKPVTAPAAQREEH